MWECRGRLLATKYFWCDCVRCSAGSAPLVDGEPVPRERLLDALRCPACGGAVVVADGGSGGAACTGSEDGTGCPAAVRMSPADVAAALDECTRHERAAADLAAMNDTAAAKAALERALAATRSRLHACHHAPLALLVQLVNAACRLAMFPDALVYSRLALAHLARLAAAAGVSDCLPDASDLVERRAELLHLTFEAVEAGLLAWPLAPSAAALDAAAAAAAAQMIPNTAAHLAAAAAVDPLASPASLGHSALLDASQACYGICHQMRLVCYGPHHPKTLETKAELAATLAD
ncbi:hypothetical protein HK105_208442 [Polyrhizophydium stewartii]|uniref:Uncharacterized protein n=1 Tax=Polyrhizophydium stewartii TaxID=2732419 RepID=A0ABR4MXW3_9FUNG